MQVPDFSATILVIKAILDGIRHVVTRASLVSCFRPTELLPHPQSPCHVCAFANSRSHEIYQSRTEMDQNITLADRLIQVQQVDSIAWNLSIPVSAEPVQRSPPFHLEYSMKYGPVKS